MLHPVRKQVAATIGDLEHCWALVTREILTRACVKRTALHVGRRALRTGNYSLRVPRRSLRMGNRSLRVGKLSLRMGRRFLHGFWVLAAVAVGDNRQTVEDEDEDEDEDEEFGL
jgi:hypothetical protein